MRWLAHFWTSLFVVFFIENYDIQEVKGFFENNYSHIYYIFYEVFVNVETDLKQRGKWGRIC